MEHQITKIIETDNQIPQPLSVLGINVIPFDSPEHAVSYIVNRIAQGRKTFCVAINPEKVYKAVREPGLAAVLNGAEIQICDGIGIVWAAMLLSGRNIERCTGIQLFFDLIRKAAEQNLKVFLLGGSPKSNELAYSNLSKMHPALKIVGRHSGYFENSQEIIKLINDSHADMLFIAMGSPKQEFWISEYRKEINARFCMGIGGTLDVISRKTKWAPKVFRKTGTEFVYRLIIEPKRWRRQLVLPKFALMILKERLFSSQITS